MTILNRLFLIIAVIFSISISATAADQFVAFKAEGTLLCQKNKQIKICVSDNDNVGVKLATTNLVKDIEKVIGTAPAISSSADNSRIIIGTLGQSTVIDQLAKEGKIDAKELKGKIEKYIIYTQVEANGQQCLVIAGSDRRGTIYGIYELSRQIGVSPWYYWADVPVAKHDKIYIKEGKYTDGEPAVRYRGIFLNDEAPCLTTWVKNTFGTNYGGHKFYEKVFELILRLKGNYIWPAMWSWAFYEDDPLNSKTADDMGVMIGTSHHEPMCRPQQEWHRFRGKDQGTPAGNQKWNYATNKAQLDRFWYAGVERNKNTEDIITIGMRGDGDEAMSDTRNVKLLENIIANQRKLISKARGKKAQDVPQMWALYKEVQDYYDDGMKVPDDVTILLCDDNWGNVRRVPTMKERQRKGGWGLYYHVDYVGAPRNSKTLNITPIGGMWEQLNLAYNNGIDKLWILNVGDLKPMEYPIQLFLDMAWNGPGVTEKVESGKETVSAIKGHVKDFCKNIVGEEEAAEAARILEELCKLNGRVTPEMLDANTYNLQSGEWAEAVDEYKTLEIEALRQYSNLPAEARDAYFQVILFPVQLMTNLYQMYYAQAMNNALYKKGDAAMNEWADKCEQYFKRDAKLMNVYNKEIANGKWDGMMIQKHIGYTSWNDNFRQDTMPKVYRTGKISNIFEEDGKGYISIEAEHFCASADGKEAKWTVFPGMGRTLSGVSLMPVTADINGASLTYKFKYEQKTKDIVRPTVHIITKSTLDYLNKGGLTYSVAIDGGNAETVNFNSNLNELPENIYNIYYPTVARRVVEKTVSLPLGSSADGTHTLTFIPNDPGIVIEKIVIDFGGYKKQYLFGKESLRK